MLLKKKLRKNNMNKIKINKKIEYIILGLLFVGISVFFAYSAGILSSGYHFTDDHEIIDINNQIRNNGFFHTLSFFIKDDLVWRFRPLFFVVRVFRALLFGTNYYLWHLTVAIECGLYIAFTYILAREMKTPLLASIIFSFIYLIGSQDEMIWRMGTQENMGMFFLALSFLLVYEYSKTNKKSIGICSVISIIFMMLCKESFLVIGPTMILFLFFLEIEKGDNNIKFFISIKDFIIKHKAFIIAIIVSLLASLAIIIFGVGLMESGYAGVDTSYTIGEYIRITLNVFLRDLKDYWLAFGISFILLIASFINKLRNKQINSKYLMLLFVGIVLIGYSLGIEAFLHAKSAMFDRYKLPCVWFIFFAIVVLQKDAINSLIYHLIVFGLCAFLIITYKNAGSLIYEDAKYYGKEGEHTTEMLEYVNSLKTKYKDMTILTDFVWYEHNLSSSMYLQIENSIDDVFCLDREREDGDYKKIYNKSNKRIYFDDANIILTDMTNIDNYNKDDYTVMKFSPYYVLEKK